jgi:hypothetical protein
VPGAAETFVEAVSEGCVAIRLVVWQDIGGLDPKVFVGLCRLSLFLC